jgi:hypothetical protein
MVVVELARLAAHAFGPSVWLSVAFRNFVTFVLFVMNSSRNPEGGALAIRRGAMKINSRECRTGA